MAVQVRRGSYVNFDPNKLVPGEWAAVTAGDPNSEDGMAVYMCFVVGTVKRMATYEDMQENINAVTASIQAQLTAAVQQAVWEAETATSNAETAATAANAAAQEADEATQEALDAAEEARSYVLGDISDKTVTFSEASARENINTGESTATLFGKIKKWFSDLGAAAFQAVANNLTTTTEGSVLDARQGKELKSQIDALNTKTDPQDIEISLGPKFTGIAYAKKVGYIIMIDVELTPSSAVANNDLVMSGLPAPTGGAFYTVLTTGNGNYTAIINTNGELRIYYPGYTDASRIDCGLCYIRA